MIGGDAGYLRRKRFCGKRWEYNLNWAVKGYFKGGNEISKKIIKLDCNIKGG